MHAPAFSELRKFGLCKSNCHFLYGRRSLSLKNYVVSSVLKPGLGSLSWSATCGLEGVGTCKKRLDRNIHLADRAVTSSVFKGQMSFFGDMPALRPWIPAAAAENAAMEAGYGSNAESADTQNPMDRDAATATSLRGVICPPMKTVGKSTNIVWQECMVKKEERQKLLGQKGCVIWITGLSGSGKSTLACTLDHALLSRAKLSYVLDGDNVRHGLNNNLSFSTEDRAENIRRVGEVAKLFVDAGIICIASVISPYRKDRDACRQLVKPGEFIEVYMNFPLNLCEKRDPKGLYKLARAGKIKGFTGVDDPYEPPLNCEVVMEPIDGRCPTPTEMAAQLVSYLEDRCFLGTSL